MVAMGDGWAGGYAVLRHHTAATRTVVSGGDWLAQRERLRGLSQQLVAGHEAGQIGAHPQDGLVGLGGTEQQRRSQQEDQRIRDRQQPAAAGGISGGWACCRAWSMAR